MFEPCPRFLPTSADFDRIGPNFGKECRATSVPTWARFGQTRLSSFINSDSASRRLAEAVCAQAVCAQASATTTPTTPSTQLPTYILLSAARLALARLHILYTPKSHATVATGRTPPLSSSTGRVRVPVIPDWIALAQGAGGGCGRPQAGRTARRGRFHQQTCLALGMAVGVRGGFV